MTFFSPPDPPTHSISTYFSTMARRGAQPPGGGRRPKAAASIVEKYVEIECVGGSVGLKNVIVCLQDYTGGQIGSPCNTAQGVPISYLGQ